MAIADDIRTACIIGGDLTAIDLDGVTLSWSAWGQGIEVLSNLLDEAGLGTDSLIGLLGRNRLEQLSGFVAVLGSGRALSLVNAVRPVGLIAEEICELRLSCLLGSRDDLGEPVIAAARDAGTMIVAIDVVDGGIRFSRRSEAGAGPFRARGEDTLVEIQTSGTTGKPKRIPMAESSFAGTLNSSAHNAAGQIDRRELKPKASPTLMFGPLVHTSGTINTLVSIFDIRPIILFEKFDAVKYRRALRTYRPKFAPLPPAAMKMMADSDATREDFASVIAVRAGTSALPIALHDAFEERFGVPVLTTYGATEFMGTASNWTLDEYRLRGKAKRGSVGRASPGAQLRVVDPQTGDALGTNQPGILEVKLARIGGGRDWLRTSDVARIDDDGYLFIVGRADDAIIRGGFKIMAGKVSDMLCTFPGIRDAVVLGMADDRLGEVPVALVEPYAGVQINPEAIRAWLKDRLNAYEVPVRIHRVARLPRTVSDKISKVDARRLLAEIEG
jgi:long-chain acyl-CoA synthetase